MKRIVVYFSYSNNTKKLVEGINKEFNFDTIRIERNIPYSDDYDTCAYKEAKEEYEKHIHPEIKDIDIDFSKYDEIDLFFPIWWYTIPMAIATFLENLKDFKGKIVFFANSYTNDPQYMENSYLDLKTSNHNLNFEKGLFNKSLKEHLNYFKKKIK